MVQTSNNLTVGTPHPANRGGRIKLVPVVLQLLAMIAIGALVYPSAADWVSRIGHNSEISGYASEVAQLPEAARQEHINIAHDYNTNLPGTVLQDPYGAGGNTEQLEQSDAYQAYREVMRVSDNGVIGELSYPNLGINLPVFHGTSEAAISKGVGHLYGSSLPIGGPSTHSVLTSHSGLVHSSLFTPLLKAETGDTFTLTVLGETHHYAVDGIETIEPFVTDSLRVVPGEDRVTLITCTPLGINSHRLLVHAIRVDAPDTGTGTHVMQGDNRTLGIPWWAIIFISGSWLSWRFLFPKAKNKTQRRQHAPQQHSEHHMEEPQ